MEVTTMLNARAVTSSFCYRIVKAVVFVLVLGTLSACKVQPVYNETPTAPSQAASDATPAPTVPPTAVPETPVPTPTPVISGPPLLRIEPPTVELAAGETSSVQVLLDNIENLVGIELHISFEPGYVNVEDADPAVEGVQISPGAMPVPAQVLQNEANNGAGVIIYHVTQDAASPARGSGVVASFTVRAVNEGGSPLRFNIVKLLDPAGQPLAVDDQLDGLVVISAAGAAATDGDSQPSATSTPAPTTPPASDAPAAGDVYHTVQPGENLYRISLRYGTTVDAIVAANNLPSRDSIKVGQVLRIPGSGTTGRVTYVVKAGDTLYSIARRYGKTVDALAALNGISAPYTIKVGQVLVIEP
jgi:LysM repeat protein